MHKAYKSIKTQITPHWKSQTYRTFSPHRERSQLSTKNIHDVHIQVTNGQLIGVEYDIISLAQRGYYHRHRPSQSTSRLLEKVIIHTIT